jgi:hypothetical protein
MKGGRIIKGTLRITLLGTGVRRLWMKIFPDDSLDSIEQIFAVSVLKDFPY